MEIELEKTYLLKYLPEDLANFKSIEYLDIYLPQSAEHPILRIRKKGQEYEITKKYPVKGLDSSKQYEFTIKLDASEYNELEAKVQGKRFRKIRYFYTSQDISAEIDIYQDDLAGLAIVDFEFKTEEEMKDFKAPDFCLIEVTQDKEIAGGMLAGKKYADLKEYLDAKAYQPLYK